MTDAMIEAAAVKKYEPPVVHSPSNYQQFDSRYPSPPPPAVKNIAQLLNGIVDPHANDVVSGRGHFSNTHSGNENFRRLINNYKNDYMASDKAEKASYVKIIYNEIQAMDPPGRFLIQDPKTGLWNDIGKKKALKKTRQALRDGAKEKEADPLGDSDKSDEFRCSIRDLLAGNVSLSSFSSTVSMDGSIDDQSQIDHWTTKEAKAGGVEQASHEQKNQYQQQAPSEMPAAQEVAAPVATMPYGYQHQMQQSHAPYSTNYLLANHFNGTYEQQQQQQQQQQHPTPQPPPSQYQYGGRHFWYPPPQHCMPSTYARQGAAVPPQYPPTQPPPPRYFQYPPAPNVTVMNEYAPQLTSHEGQASLGIMGPPDYSLAGRNLGPLGSNSRVVTDECGHNLEPPGHNQTGSNLEPPGLSPPSRQEVCVVTDEHGRLHRVSPNERSEMEARLSSLIAFSANRVRQSSSLEGTKRRSKSSFN